MDFELTEDQALIRQTVADFVKKELPLERMRKMREDELGLSKAVLKQMGELGWLGLVYPEELGGFGGSFVDAALVLEELGKKLVHEPYADSTIVAGRVLLELGNDAQKEAYLSPMIAGDKVLALAYAESDNRFDITKAQTTAEKAGDQWKIKGDKRWVLYGNAADALIVTAQTSEGLAAFVVDADRVSRRSVKTMDGRRAAMVTLDCTVDAAALLGAPGHVDAALDKAFDCGAAAACAEGYGVIQACLDMTLEYIKTREQFGKKIGAFQVLQHRAVDMFVEAELAKSVSIMAAIKVDSDDVAERQRSISAAKAQIAVSGKLVSQQAVQLHGGIGVTEEHDISLYFKRMHVLNTVYGDETFHVQRFASLTQ